MELAVAGLELDDVCYTQAAGRPPVRFPV